MSNKPIYINLFHLKSVNGMYYYAVDYFLDSDYRIVCNSKAKDVAALFHDDQRLIKLNIFNYFLFYLRAVVCNFSVFTPTPHPLPFLSKQVVVLHDSYPFRVGRLSFFKKLLFYISLKSSKTKVGYVNFSDAKLFLERLNVPEDRCLFMPNKIPTDFSMKNTGYVRPKNLVSVGAVGTDSLKKNYKTLFYYLQQFSSYKKINLYLLGQDNIYIKNLRREFPSVNLQVVDSGQVTLEEFFDNVDVILSVAKGEGFCRPVAMALQMGIPCLLIDDPVFKEFYEDVAIFFRDFNEFKEGIFTIMDENFRAAPLCLQKLESQHLDAKCKLAKVLEQNYDQ